MDLYGCSLWNFGSNYVETSYTASRKAIRTIWKLLFRTHCNLLYRINDTLPIDIMLEQRCIKFIWTLLHSPNIIVKSVMRYAIRNGYSTLDENFIYFSYKYNLSQTLWISPLCNIYKCINDYVTDFIVTPDISDFIRELCICRNSGDFSVLTSTEILQLYHIIFKYFISIILTDIIICFVCKTLYLLFILLCGMLFYALFYVNVSYNRFFTEESQYILL